MAIILPHTTSDIQFFRSNGVCYRRTDWGVEGTPDTSWDEIVDTPYNDFGTYATCSDCQNAVSVPPTCPCTTDTFTQVANSTIPSCGYTLDPIYRQYRLNFANFQPCPDAFTQVVSEDQPLMTDLINAQPISQCNWKWTVDYVNESSPIRIPGTLLAPKGCGPSGCGAGMYLHLKPGVAWVFYFSMSSSGSGWSWSSTHVWIKTTGVTPAGVYTALPCGTDASGYGIAGTSNALAPSSFVIEAVIP